METLGKVWALVDPSGSGKIAQNQFLAAMYLIQKLRLGTLASVPSSIPQSLWNSIARATDATPVSTTPSTHPLGSLGLTSIPELPWAVPDSDRKQFYGFFDKIDKAKTGYLSGEQCYSFFLKSKLPENHLAVVWYVIYRFWGKR